jgi:hypothetical protein
MDEALMDYGHGKLLIDCIAAFVVGVMSTLGAIIANHAWQKRKRR